MRMKLPRWNGVSPSAYVFWLVCFLVGFGVMTALSLGRVTYDDRDGPGWSPITKMSDGRVGLSEMALEVIGVVAMGVGGVGLVLLLKNFQLS